MAPPDFPLATVTASMPHRLMRNELFDPRPQLARFAPRGFHRPAMEITAWEWQQHQLRISFRGPWRVHRLWTRDNDASDFQLTELTVDYFCNLVIYFSASGRARWNALQCTPTDAGLETPARPLEQLSDMLRTGGLSELARWIAPVATLPAGPASGDAKTAPPK